MVILSSLVKPSIYMFFIPLPYSNPKKKTEVGGLLVKGQRSNTAKEGLAKTSPLSPENRQKTVLFHQNLSLTEVSIQLKESNIIYNQSKQNIFWST